MATWQHLRSSTAHKRPTTSLADGRIAINTNTASPGLFFKDSAGTGIVKVGPVHVGATAPNSSPAAGGSSGNYLGEQWLDTSLTPAQLKVWNGSAWVGVVADELPVSKLQDGQARQLLQTDAAGTGVEWTSNVDVPGTLDVTSTATFDSIAQHPVGSATAPTITFTGDTNTGIYSPGADQLALSTNGTGRLFINSAGFMGVGIETPLDDIHIASTTPAVLLEETDASTDEKRWRIRAGSSTLNFEGVNDAFSSAALFMRVVRATASSQTDSLIFYTGASSERLRITSAGLVGIGTSAPTASLHLQAPAASSGHDLLKLINGADAAELVIDTSANAVNFKPGPGDALAFWDPSSERVRITSAGLVGIGTSAPETALTVGTDGFRLLNFANNINSFPSIAAASSLIATTGGGGTGVYANFGTLLISARNQAVADSQIAFITGTSERVRIDSSGRLGIGTTSPISLAHISSGDSVSVLNADADDLFVSNSDNAGITIATGANNKCTIAFGEAGVGNSRGRIVYDTSDESAQIYTANSERARIDNAGRLLVGTSSDSGGALLQVNGNRIRVATAKTPASASDTGTTGEICWDANYIYVCTATNTWKRTALSTW